MRFMNLIHGKQNTALKVVIYGPEGIGKSTLAARFPRPVFLDTEGSTKHMDVTRMEKPSSWTMLLEQVKYLRDHPKVCATLVLDTADWAEQLCTAELCARSQRKGIEDFGYGKGYVYLAEDFGKLLHLLTEVVDRGIHVVITAHAKMRKFEQPDELGAYDRWELKLSKGVAPLVKEWADLVLFSNYKTTVVNVDGQGAAKGKNKVQGGKRVMYTSHHPCWDAKNRFGLPDELPLAFEAIAPLVPDLSRSSAPAPPPPPPPPEPPAPPAAAEPDPAPPPAPQTASRTADEVPAALDALMRQSVVTENEVREVIAEKGYYTMDTPWSVMETSGFVEGWIVPFWDKIVQMIEDKPDRLPF